ncbi:hypothetical protein SLEP1_g45233 [Rubroshorea leprosula]|uniref:CCHC-type domain-containing protein n=1 Tax=Rubroshorea leprosula TaxID=152421 RepID=A0AAV5LIJ7_9ROSI|nr:hypothetical protein SLEP1_g45233 [Rubroshorea leprosula]
MEVLNLKKEFALIRMKDTETVKEFSDRLTKVVNKIRLQGEELSDKVVVEKVLVSLLEKFEHKISSLEDSKDLSQFSLNELVNALQAVEQRKALRLENNVEGAYLATDKEKAVAKDDENKQLGDQRNREKEGYQNNKKESYASCSHCKKKGHSEKYCWFRPGVQCRKCKQFGHVERVCKEGSDRVQQAKIAEIVEEEEHLFMAIKIGDCSASILSSDSWLIDNGCSNHMTPNVAIFKSLDRKYNSKVKLGNGELMEVKGKGVATVETQTGIKYIHDVLFVPNINYSLISVGQLIEHGYVLHFHDKICEVEDESGSKMFTVRMNERSFPIQWKQIEISPKASVVDVSKSEEFDESATWNWESSKIVAADQVLVANDEPIFDFGNDEFEQENDDESYDVFAIRGTRTQVDIYERCNMVIEELANYLEATRSKVGRITMQEEFAMKSCKAVNNSLYHVLLIIADGQVTRSVDTERGWLSLQEQKTVDAIVQASKLPLSIVLVGVGDGPWDMMKEFDDNIPSRAFDNFQFVNFTEIMLKNTSQTQKETEFALAALMKIPSQYKATIELNILGNQMGNIPESVPLPPLVSRASAYDVQV